jgi:DNA repair protein SbcC/Rad50
MRIDEYLISRYGPLKESGRIQPGSFTLFFGPNENGKTLTIDAVLKLLFGKDVKKFKKIQRVDEEPHGYVIIRDNRNQIVKLPEKGDLTALTGIKPEEARNIFVIRDSDLEIHEESEHYRSITDKLTGMRTEQIENVMTRLLDIGRVTETGLFTNREDKIRDRTRQADDLLEDIKVKKKEIELAKMTADEKDLAAMADSIRKINDKLEQYTRAEKREYYQKGSKALKLLRESLRSLDTLEIFKEEKEKKWVEYERDIHREEIRRNQLEQELKNEIQAIKSLEETTFNLKREFDLIDRTRTHIDQEIKPDMKNYAETAENIKKKENIDRFFSWVMGTFFFIAVLSMAAVFFNIEKTIFIPLMGISFIAAFGFGLLKFSFVRKQARLAGLFERIKLNLIKYKITGKSIEDLNASVRDFEDHWNMKKMQLEDKQSQLRLQQSRMNDLRNNHLPQVQNNIRNAEENIRLIQDKTGVKTLSGYRAKIKEKENKQNTIKNQVHLLADRFGQDFDNLEDNIREWTRDVHRLEPYRESALNLEYRQEEYESLKEQKKELEIKRQSLENHIQEFKKQLSEIEAETNRILGAETEYLPCKTSIDLMEIEKQIHNFIAGYTERRDVILKAQDIFKQIAQEEEEKIAQLFGRDSTVSGYFEQITGKRYREVNFDPGTGKVMVVTNQNEMMAADKLSGGAYDQLYLSIRLSLGKDLLSDKTGFFILDDPFIKADIDRLQEQMAVLKQIAAGGWQILYFTAKDEVRQILEQDIRNGTVDMISLPGLV